MLKLTFAHFKNYRALRDVNLSFATESHKPLTVIRAENRSGKTTMLNALGWGLFGDRALPEKRKSYRMHPIDWDGQSKVTTEVEIHFIASRLDEQVDTYRLVRTTDDTLHGLDWEPGQTILSLQVNSPEGWKPDPDPESTIQKLFPLSLHKVFFTDGDSTLTFIEADRATQRRTKVEDSIKALLQIDLLQNAKRHITAFRTTAAGKRFRNENKARENDVRSEYEALTAEIQELEDSSALLTDNLKTASQYEEDNERQIEEALRQCGADPAKLVNELSEIKSGLDRERASLETKYKELAKHLLFENSCIELSFSLFPDLFSDVGKSLDNLEQTGAIPDVIPSVARDRLERGTCICGQPLNEGSPGWETLTSIISTNEQRSQYSPILVALQSDLRSWQRQYETTSPLTTIERQRSSIRDHRSRIEELKIRRKQIERDLEGINSSHIEQLKTRRDQHRKDCLELREKLGAIQANLHTKNIRKTKLEPQISSLTNFEKSASIADMEFQAAHDLLEVVSRTIERLGAETLDKVSGRMNTIFHQMNASQGSEDNTIIESITISDKYDIIVSGPGGRVLNPSADLSGAQKRALTLSFILSLVDVSGFEAPNIIDTPLGTQSGQVRRNMLSYTIQNSTQLILFLTKDEIAGVGDIIRDNTLADAFWTLTNTAQSDELVCPRLTGHKETLICSCSIDQSCEICQRKEMI